MRHAWRELDLVAESRGVRCNAIRKSADLFRRHRGATRPICGAEAREVRFTRGFAPAGARRTACSSNSTLKNSRRPAARRPLKARSSAIGDGCPAVAVDRGVVAGRAAAGVAVDRAGRARRCRSPSLAGSGSPTRGPACPPTTASAGVPTTAGSGAYRRLRSWAMPSDRCPSELALVRPVFAGALAPALLCLTGVGSSGRASLLRARAQRQCEDDGQQTDVSHGITYDSWRVVRLASLNDSSIVHQCCTRVEHGRLGEMPSAAGSLFGPNLPPGFLYQDDFISTAEQAGLVDHINQIEFAP